MRNLTSLVTTEVATIEVERHEDWQSYLNIEEA